METMEYELARNLTLLFFLERLLDKGEPRLKKFLASYPALFYINGDYVHVNTYLSASPDDPSGATGGRRDYTQEAKEYFKNKLLMYGLGTEVPIRSLLGHRSQASPQVRHISGQHIKEFTDFLSKHPDTFTVIDEHVMLVETDDLKDIPVGERLHLPQPSIDTIATQQLLDFFAHWIENKGLKKFLASYPALFYINGDYVHVNTYLSASPDDPSGATGGRRDYTQEAKEYFKNKLLIKHPDTFTVIDEHVMLVETDDLKDIPVGERLHLPQPSIDTIATQQLLDFFAHWIENKGPILVDQLFHIVTSKFPEEMWLRMFKTPSDLSTFLKLFSDCFHIQSNLVTLLQKPRLSDAHIQQAQARARDQFNNNPTMRTLSPQMRLQNNNNLMQTIGDFKLNEPVTSTSSNSPTVSNKSEPNSGFESLVHDNDAKLDNLCDRNCPSGSIGSYYTRSSTPPTIPAHQNPSVQVQVAQQPVEKTPAKNQTLKQRINSLVIKTLAENLEKDKQAMSALQAGNAANMGDGKAQNTNSAHMNNYFVGDTWKIKVLQNTRVIATIKECLFVTEAILKSAANDQVVISFDCEGINLGAKGQLTLVEIGTTRGEAFIFDILTCPEMVSDGGLKTLLESENVIKIIHDCRNDSINLFNQFGILMRNVFDTQSAHAILQLQNHGKQVYKVKNVSLNTLCEMYGAPINPMKDQLKNVYRRDQKYWARRPLSRDMLLYAAGDVLVLINEQLYAAMASNREIRLLRYLDLTEEEKEKLKGSYKVAKKLEKLENLGQDRDQSDSEDDGEVAEHEYASLDSVPSDNSLPGAGTFSPRNSEPPSLTESMQLMDEILSDTTMDRMAKIDKLEAILSTATLLPNDPVFSQTPDQILSATSAILNANNEHNLKHQSYRDGEHKSDLSTFLKLFSDCFHIQSNLVTLLQKPRLSDAHIQQAQARARDQFNNNPTMRTLSPQMRLQNNNNLMQTIGDFKLNEPVTSTSSNSPTVSNKSEPNSGFESLVHDNDAKLDNLCDRNCPSGSIGSYYTRSSTPPTIPAHQNPSVQVQVAQQPVEKTPAKNQTLKQRINSLVIKTLAENLEKDKQAMSALQAGNAANMGDGKAQNTNSAHMNNYFVGDTWKIKVLQNTRVIATIKECLFVTEAILKSAANDQVVISFDCEGINLGAKGQLTLVEIGTTRGEAFIFDILTCPEMVSDGGLKTLLESENVIKIIHDCRNDSINLSSLHPHAHVFDTQSAHAILQLQNHGKQVYKVKNVSLNTLCEMYGAPINPMKDQLKNVYRRDQKYWARRPLSRDMLLYAAGDVLVLINEQLYAAMASNREIRLLRYLDLTEEEKEKLKGSYKVAKKLEKLENLGQDRDQSDSEDDGEVAEHEYASLDSVPSDNSLPGAGTFSPRNSEPPSLTESMQLMDEILSDTTMDRMAKIDKLEAILSTATLLPNDPVFSQTPDQILSATSAILNANNEHNLKHQSYRDGEHKRGSNRGSVNNSGNRQKLVMKQDEACQTLSTGDIVITKIFFKEDQEKAQEKILTSTPKKVAN
uniref:Putative exonuclease n=1 Tax=Lutzomyia longipalpis TaxID=7200 RepID=A0A1B0C935_LUTLO